jgi:hypothetical protein
MSEPVLYRAMRDSDAPYIFSTWMKWARNRGRWVQRMPNRVFWDDQFGYRAHVEYILRRSKVIVACDPESEDYVFGYAVGEPPHVMHFVFVDVRMRQRAKGLLADSIGRCLVDLLRLNSKVTATMDDREGGLPDGWTLDPFITPLAGVEFAAWARGWRDSVSGVVPRRTGT